MSEPVSVLVPIRPQSQFVEQLARNFLKQSYPNLRLIAVLDRDDGTTETKLKLLIPHDCLILVHAREGKGDVGGLLNLGIRVADTELIARMDDDDVYSDDRIADQVLAMSRELANVLVGSTADVVDERNRLLYQVVPPKSDREFKLALMESNCVAHSCVLYKKSAVLNAGGYRVGMQGCEDYDLWLRMMHTGRFVGLPISHVKYLVHAGGASKRRVPTSKVAKIYIARLQAARHLEVSKLRRHGGYLRWLFHFRPHWVSIVNKLLEKVAQTLRRLHLR